MQVQAETHRKEEKDVMIVADVEIVETVKVDAVDAEITTAAVTKTD
jgi:hypothetical protein